MREYIIFESIQYFAEDSNYLSHFTTDVNRFGFVNRRQAYYLTIF